MLVAPDWRMSSWVRTEIAAGVCQISSGSLEAVVTSTSPSCASESCLSCCAGTGLGRYGAEKAAGGMHAPAASKIRPEPLSQMCLLLCIREGRFLQAEGLGP